MLQKFSLLLGAIVLAIGFLVVFFGGTWEGARIGLEILGAIWLIQTTYSVIIKNHEEERKKERSKRDYGQVLQEPIKNKRDCFRLDMNRVKIFSAH